MSILPAELVWEISIRYLIMGILMSHIHSTYDGVGVIPESTNLLSRTEMFDAQNVLMPRPASFWSERSRAEKILFGNVYNLYQFPTTELIAELNRMINGRTAIEIAAGNGCISRSLAIPGTDSRHMDEPDVSELCAVQSGLVALNYGPHVERLEASLAVAKYQPKVVIGAWVPHLYDPKRHDLGGSITGVDEHYILSEVDEYILIGNTAEHQQKPLIEDLHCGKIITHRVKQYFVGAEMLQTRSSRGLNFLLRLSRI